MDELIPQRVYDKDKLKILERLKALNGQEKLLTDVSKFYPPVIPQIVFSKKEACKPIHNNSALEHRFIVRQFADAFRQEATILFEKPNLGFQFSPFQSEEFNAILILGNHIADAITEVQVQKFREETVDKFIYDVFGCCLFYKDSRLHKDKKEICEWIGNFAWVHPFHRGNKAFASIEHTFESYGTFWIEGPVSDTMKEIMKKRGIEQSRILDSERYKIRVEEEPAK